MGYEIELFVGELVHIGSSSGTMFDDIARVELGTPGYYSAIYKASMDAQKAYKVYGKGTTVYIYEDDGNASAVKDYYDSPLLALDIECVIEALTLDVKSGYSRFDMALELLKITQQYYPDAKVVLFGH